MTASESEVWSCARNFSLAYDRSEEKKFASLKAHPVLYNRIPEIRVHFVVTADLSEGTQFDLTVMGELGRIARDAGYRGEDGSD